MRRRPVAMPKNAPMRFLVLAAEPLDVARGSGTAMAVMRLRRALADAGVSVPLLMDSHRVPWSGAWRGPARSHDYDALLGVGGAGWQVADALGIPFVALLKAFYAGAARYERGLSRLLLIARARAERRGARRADAVIVPSSFAATAVAREYGVDPIRIHVVPEPFALDEWRDALPARERSGGRVLCVAHLYPRKRVIDLLRAWPLVLRAGADARLDIVGGGPELRRLVHAAREAPACYLHGHVGHPAVAEFYARADAFCLPSAQETFGYAAVEAMASGLPLAIAAAGALPEVCAGAVAETAPCGDPAALAAAVLRTLDPRARSRAAEVNPERVRAFHPSRVAARTIAVVERAREAAQRRAGGSVSRSAPSRR